ncbi:C4-dicarboxylate ABC transporter, partial [bacterium]|nr:C4-dicarboxylate ABC transporter [bacterium]
IDIDELAPKPKPFNSAQLQTLAAVLILILAIVIPGLPGMKGMLPKAFLNLVSNVGTVAFILSGWLMLTGAGDSEKAIKSQPWAVII